MRRTALANSLRKFLQSTQGVSADDENFYTAHRGEVIERLTRFSQSVELAYLTCQIKTNDAFRYIVLFLTDKRDKKRWQPSWELHIRFVDSSFVVSYVGYDVSTERKLYKTAFYDVDALFAYLDLLKWMITRLIEDMRNSEP